MGHAKKLLLCLLIIIVQYYSNAFLLINKKTHDRSALAPLKDILGAKGGATISKDKVLKAKSSSKRSKVYKKEGFLKRLTGGLRLFWKSYFASLISPSFEKDLDDKPSSGVSLATSAARRKRIGGRRIGSISSLAPEPASCGASSCG